MNKNIKITNNTGEVALKRDCAKIGLKKEINTFVSINGKRYFFEFNVRTSFEKGVV